jgi:hypothetical protein
VVRHVGMKPLRRSQLWLLQGNLHASEYSLSAAELKFESFPQIFLGFYLHVSNPSP